MEASLRLFTRVSAAITSRLEICPPTTVYLKRRPALHDPGLSLAGIDWHAWHSVGKLPHIKRTF
ncbi:hypothetical protein IscW_ISCW002302 [Ixodes scapularis]|uniref:Uncharacterized protein n=1 Tax=Ixodes scapularis TaxID=6945 RepID=B7P7T6_IXOSC|nr:hypothetical protein IscW_ISCW002302 [Ixodes scapularis]|eukprot:XP_002399570.1 hypothetical protein IscW_ISCW002302 [Ixodes scapularis]